MRRAGNKLARERAAISFQAGLYGMSIRMVIGYNPAMSSELKPAAAKSSLSPEVWTVSQLTRRVKGLLETQIGSVWVSGEISNWRVSPAGHAYFTLKDGQGQLSAVMFKGRLSRVKFEPENGLEVIVNGLVSVYEQRGTYQIVCDGMQPRGIGALQLAFEKLKARLDAEGLFDPSHKKPLPRFPRRIGIVTSPTGAAIRDILNVLERRHAGLHVIIFPARVQGDGAAAEIAEGIRTLDDYGVDAMIVGRGGGSLEDLWPFNEEAVVRAIYNAATPIVSAVGHEIDFTLSDFAADLRAPTPSAAAELVVQERQALVEGIGLLKNRMGRALARRLDSVRSRLDLARSGYVFRRPEELVRQRRQRCDELRMALETAVAGRVRESRRRLDTARAAMRLLSPAMRLGRAQEHLVSLRHRVGQGGRACLRDTRARLAAPAGLLRAGRLIVPRARARFVPAVARLDALSPLAILSRGYAIAWKMPAESIVRDSAELAVSDKIRVRFGKGRVLAEVREISNDRSPA